MMHRITKPDAPPPPRTHVTLAYEGEPVKLPKVLGRDGQGRPAITVHELRDGDNTLPIAYWHAIGGDPVVQGLIGSGKIRPVCREHRFEERTDLAHGDDPPPVFCAACGHSPESALS